jgi:hypothetical protein
LYRGSPQRLVGLSIPHEQPQSRRNCKECQCSPAIRNKSIGTEAPRTAAATIGRVKFNNDRYAAAGSDAIGYGGTAEIRSVNINPARLGTARSGAPNNATAGSIQLESILPNPTSSNSTPQPNPTPKQVQPDELWSKISMVSAFYIQMGGFAYDVSDISDNPYIALTPRD